MKSKKARSEKMKMVNRIVALIFFTLCFIAVWGQKIKSVTPSQLDYRSSVQVDGDLSDWGDSLRFIYDKQLLQYEIANDDHNLYVAMRVRDGAQQMQALHQGFNFMINKEGKKKEGAAVTFPIPDRESLRSLAAKEEEEKPEDMRTGILSTVRAIYVSGLDDVVDGPISLENNYGIKTAVAIDSSDAICYEAVIPLQRLGIDHTIENKLAFNLKINGIVMRTVGGGMPANRYNRYGGYGYGYPYGYGAQLSRKEARQEPGVWVVLPLAKPN
ncbi:hypothetical protein H8S90_04800 [Olivibacter sp. SDN3]|uniref:hypothetical protein n=1 Tax=Olivibacter sp. SDN3 TaxID=2764720 RepID=UPI0016511A2C|nr:hypothetical protein [Olivibacter sp. SDN3]QNL50911.1 hypothetical protein H8S90_04800 [Olivibacter sp. SDN3]